MKNENNLLNKLENIEKDLLLKTNENKLLNIK
jgi:hypothetical protein